MQVELNNKRLRYSGRVDWRNPGRPEFVFPCTSLRFRFWGRSAVLTVENRNVCWENFAGAIVDGVQKKWRLDRAGETVVRLVEEDEGGEHEVLFFKRQDGCHEMVLKELELSEGSRLLILPEKEARRMEVYGDSVSAGEVSEAVAYTGRTDPEHQGEYSNGWYSYAWTAARMLRAELHDIAQGGISFLNGNGYVEPPAYPGMEEVWDKLHYHPRFGKAVPWDFSAYTPHLVVVAVGQNDSHPQDYMKEEPDGVRAAYWKYRYEAWIRKLRETYPKAVILLTTTLLCHDESWDRAIEEVCRRIDDDRIRHYLYRRNGCGTPGHLRISEAEEMAAELADYVEHLDIDVWTD